MTLDSEVCLAVRMQCWHFNATKSAIANSRNRHEEVSHGYLDKLRNKRHATVGFCHVRRCTLQILIPALWAWIRIGYYKSYEQKRFQHNRLPNFKYLARRQFCLRSAFIYFDWNSHQQKKQSSNETPAAFCFPWMHKLPVVLPGTNHVKLYSAANTRSLTS